MISYASCINIRYVQTITHAQSFLLLLLGRTEVRL